MLLSRAEEELKVNEVPEEKDGPKASEGDARDLEVYETFDEMNLREDLLR